MFNKGPICIKAQKILKMSGHRGILYSPLYSEDTSITRAVLKHGHPLFLWQRAD